MDEDPIWYATWISLALLMQVKQSQGQVNPHAMAPLTATVIGQQALEQQWGPA